MALIGCFQLFIVIFLLSSVLSFNSRSAYRELADIMRALKEELSDREFYGQRMEPHQEGHSEVEQTEEHQRKDLVKKAERPPDCSMGSNGQEICIMNSAGETTVKENCVFAHNKVRSYHGVPDLKWSSSLADSAREWAFHLAEIGYMEHTTAANYGENLYWWSASYDAQQTCGNAVYDWYSECAKPMGQDRLYDYSADQNMGTLHFTQVVWKTTTKVGCGISKVGDVSYYVVCQYSPKGNWMGEFVDNVLQPNPSVVFGTPELDSAYDIEVAGQCFNKFDGCDQSSCTGMFSEYYRPFCGKECNEGCS